MFNALANSIRIPDLKKRIIFTLALIIVYRIGCYVPTPGINGQALAEFFSRMSKAGGGGTIFGIINMFTGGAMERLTIFALGIMPYISASIILQLLTAVIPALEKLSKEGRAGYEKINQYTRYGTVALCIIQAFFVALWLENPSRFEGLNIVSYPGWGFRILTVLTLTTGTIFVMWLGEQIQARGIGNGISLVITAGIISRIPAAIHQLVLLSPFSAVKRQIQPFTLIIMVALLVGVVFAVVMITQGQRKIPVQYARRIVGRKIYGGQSTYIPLKVDTAGVIAIIFAQSIILFPATLASFVPNPTFQSWAQWLVRGHLVYTIVYGLLILFFCYFYTAIVINPLDLSENMKKYGGFIPGIRPGKPTAEYIDFVLTRITLAGALFIVFIAIFPDFIMAWLKVPYLVASFFGGTGILIVVGVMLDTLKQIESHLLMHNYEGFIKQGRIRGRR